MGNVDLSQNCNITYWEDREKEACLYWGVSRAWCLTAGNQWLIFKIKKWINISVGILFRNNGGKYQKK